MFPTCAINNGRTREHPSAQVGCFRLAPLIMAELGNTRVLRRCGVLLVCQRPGLRFAPSGLRLLMLSGKLGKK
jgi:hypothetical protein